VLPVTEHLALPDTEQLADFLPDWRVHLRAKGRSRRTIESYLAVAVSFCNYLRTHELPSEIMEVRRTHIEQHLAELHDRVSPATVAKHYRSLQQLFRWLVGDGELNVSPMAGMTAPSVPEQPVPIIEMEDLAALLTTCRGNTFENRRDLAVFRLFLDTGMRAGELIGLTVDDIDREQSLAFVVGKGNRQRACPFGARTADALRRYMRVRTRHPMAATSSALWIGKKGPLTDSGVRQLLERRCKDAGVPAINPHMFRHLFAHMWLANGGQENDLMRLAGWRSREMVGRYAASAADGRAREAHKRMALGDRV
jgi:site-specific recombinase XerD